MDLQLNKKITDSVGLGKKSTLGKINAKTESKQLGGATGKKSLDEVNRRK
jgi:hypothetical protein